MGADQGRSQACASGVAKLSWKNHVVHCLRTQFILYVIKIKWIMSVREKMEFCNMSLWPRLSSTKILRDFTLTKKIKQTKSIAKNSQGWQKARILLHRGGSCHLMATDLGWTLSTGGLKYRFQGTINAKNVRKIGFHLPTGS